jgi:hypothetical protein
MTDALAPRYGIWQAIDAAVRLAMRAIEETRALRQSPPSRRFPAIKIWSENAITYDGEIAAHCGATFQALRDTVAEPPGDDWLEIAAPGKNAPVGSVYGRYDPARKYRAFDLVAHSNAEWRARFDDPGPLPGEGWALSAAQGKRGERGERGEKGERGQPGIPGAAAPAIVGWSVAGFVATPMLSDGSEGAPLDLRAMFETYHDDVSR